MEKQPKEITACRLGCVLMPQGEVICLGKTIGWFKDLKACLSTEQQCRNLLDACKAAADTLLDLAKCQRSHPDLFEDCCKTKRKVLLKAIKEAERS